MASPASKIVQKSVSKVLRADRANSILRGQGRPPLLQWVLSTAALIGLWSSELALSLSLAFPEVESSVEIVLIRFAFSTLLTGCLALWMPRDVLLAIFGLQIPALPLLFGSWEFFDVKGVLLFCFFLATKVHFTLSRKGETLPIPVRGFVGAAMLLALIILSYYVSVLVTPDYLHRIFPFLV